MTYYLLPTMKLICIKTEVLNYGVNFDQLITEKITQRTWGILLGRGGGAGGRNERGGDDRSVVGFFF